jgi:hypothetical protein
MTDLVIARSRGGHADLIMQNSGCVLWNVRGPLLADSSKIVGATNDSKDYSLSPSALLF